MIGRKRLLRVISVLSVAVAIGQTVENMRHSAASTTAEAVFTGPRPVNDRLPSSASLYPTAGQLPALNGITSVAAVSERPESDICRPTMLLSVMKDAMINVAIQARCNAGERVVIRHSGISFTAAMGADGDLSLSLPALEEEALVAAYFDGSAVALATVDVPEVATMARFAFQAPFPLDFRLLAKPGDPADASLVRRPGAIVTLGNKTVAQPLVAQIYTLPGIDLRSAQLSVEVRITDQTCSRSFLGEARISQVGGVTGYPVPIQVPICGTAGNILLLNNLVPDLTLAAPR